MIHMAIPHLPPSSNNAYFTMVTKVGKKMVPKRVMTKEGKKFKKETSAFLVQNYPMEMQIFRPNAPYALLYQVIFDTITNKTWPEKAATRYKKLDASNRVKLLEDALVDAAGIDDSQILISSVFKSQGAHQGTRIWAWDLENETMAGIGGLIDGASVCLVEPD
jgi:hypothetical protein